MEGDGFAKYLRRFSLAFSDPSIESSFKEFYSVSFSASARKILFLVLLLLIGDFVLDFFLSPSGRAFGNFLRLTTVLPMLVYAIISTHFSWFKKNWQLWMSIWFVVLAVTLFWVLIKIDEDGGYGFVTWVGVLNFTFVIIFCFAILGIQFKYAIFAGMAVLGAYLFFLSQSSGFSNNISNYYIYHIVTLFILVAFVGWGREKYIRTDFLSRREAESERDKADGVLMNIFPASIAMRLKDGEYPIADSYGEATILFSDLEGFTSLATKFGPRHLVELLNSIFSDFDSLCEQLGLEKIKTIGDAYMAVSGAPTYCENHAEIAVNMAIGMRDVIRRLSRDKGLPIGMRIGIHTGPVIGGVIGHAKYHYDLWGDSVNIASRMESSGIIDRIQVSETTYWRTKDIFKYETRGEVSIKGKGEMVTYLLVEGE